MLRFKSEFYVPKINLTTYLTMKQDFKVIKKLINLSHIFNIVIYITKNTKKTHIDK